MHCYWIGGLPAIGHCNIPSYLLGLQLRGLLPKFSAYIKFTPKTFLTRESIRTTTDRPATVRVPDFFALVSAYNSSGLAWQWQHGYYTPVGWPAYWTHREMQLCHWCGITHLSGFWGVLAQCRSPTTWRSCLLETLPHKVSLVFTSLTFQEQKLLLHLQCSPSTSFSTC